MLASLVIDHLKENLCSVLGRHIHILRLQDATGADTLWPDRKSSQANSAATAGDSYRSEGGLPGSHEGRHEAQSSRDVEHAPESDGVL